MAAPAHTQLLYHVTSHALRLAFITIRVAFYPIVIITYIHSILVTCSQQDTLAHPVYALPRTPCSLPPQSHLRRRCAAPARHAAVCMLLAWLAFTTAPPPPPPPAIASWCTQALHNHSIARSSPASLSCRQTICSTATTTPPCAVCQAASSERGIDGGDCSGRLKTTAFQFRNLPRLRLLQHRLEAARLSNTRGALLHSTAASLKRHPLHVAGGSCSSLLSATSCSPSALALQHLQRAWLFIGHVTCAEQREIRRRQGGVSYWREEAAVGCMPHTLTCDDGTVNDAGGVFTTCAPHLTICAATEHEAVAARVDGAQAGAAAGVSGDGLRRIASINASRRR